MNRVYWVMQRTPGSDSATFDLIVAEYRWLWLAKLVRWLLNKGGYGQFYFLIGRVYTDKKLLAACTLRTPVVVPAPRPDA